jgi:hypothetical protein
LEVGEAGAAAAVGERRGISYTKDFIYMESERLKYSRNGCTLHSSILLYHYSYLDDTQRI